MTPAQILQLAMLNAHTTSTIVDPSDATLTNSYLLLNVVLDKIMNRLITDVDEGYLYEIWTDNAAVATNGEYALPRWIGTGSTFYAGAKKIERVSVKWKTTDTDYTVCTEVDPSLLPYDWDYYLDNQPTSDPIYFVADRSIFIAPQFTAANIGADPNNQIKLEGIRTWKRLTYADDHNVELEHIISLPSEFHDLVALGWEAEFKRTRLRPDEKNDAMAEFIHRMDEFVDDMGSRTRTPDEAMLPDDSNLWY